MKARCLILHLEDDPLDARLIRETLERAETPLEILAVSNKADYVSALETVRPDVILADYHIPGFDGMDALALAQGRRPGVPFIFVTGALGDEKAVETLRRGATDYVLKGRLVRLLPVVRRALAEAGEVERRQSAERALHTTEERLRVALAGSAISVHTCDRNLRITWVYKPLAGMTPEEILGKRDDDILPPESARELTEMKTRVLITRVAEHRTVRISLLGEENVYSVTAEPLFDTEGDVEGVTVAMMDVTELVRAKSAAEEASRSKDYFMAVLSHELRTPLMPIMTAVTLLERDPFGPTSRELVEMIHRNVEVEARLIDDLLDLTRIARGKIELLKRPIDLRTIVERAVEVCLSEIESAGLRLTVESSPHACPVLVDEARIQQVLWNLLKNAIKFTPAGGAISVRCSSGESSATVEVRDDGIGIDGVMLGRVFNAFEQASASRSAGGLGLGLAISKGLVELHDGAIRAESDGRGRGARFIVHLPLREPGMADPSAPATSMPAQHLSILRILLVEDHPDTALALRELLASEGHEVRIASGVAAGLALAGAGEFDLLISDLGLPDGSGTDLVAALRMSGKRQPAIALSGYGQEQDIKASILAGFDSHLVKPVSHESLTRAIAAVTAPVPRSRASGEQVLSRAESSEAEAANRPGV